MTTTIREPLNLDTAPDLEHDHLLINGEIHELTAYWDFQTRQEAEAFFALHSKVEGYANRLALDGDEALSPEELTEAREASDELLRAMFREPDEELIQNLAPWQIDQLGMYFWQGFEMGRQAFLRWNEEQTTG